MNTSLQKTSNDGLFKKDRKSQKKIDDFDTYQKRKTLFRTIGFRSCALSNLPLHLL